MSRSTYILGRYLGLIIAVFFTMAAMALLHILAIVQNHEFFREFTYGWSFWTVYPLLLLMAAGKMMVTASIALFFSLFASSQVSSLVFTASFWIAGHFWSELEFLIERAVKGGALKTVILAVASILPNFQYFNLRDTFMIPHYAGYGLVWVAFIYGFAYTGAFLALSVLWFSRKEF